MGFGSVFKSITKIFSAPIKIITKALSWLMPKPQVPDFGDSEFDTYEKGVLINKQSNDANIPVIYGTRLVGGTRVFMETSGTDNTYLYMAIVLGEGEINDITSIKIDDKTVTWSGDLADNTQRTVGSGDGNFYKDSASLITVEPHYGTDGQSASTLLSTLSSWGSAHKLSGLCYIALRFTWNQDAFQGIPRVQAIVQGRKVVAYNSSSVAQTAAHSDNPAWCLLDYLTNARYGKGLAIGDIDIPSFYTASGVCDTDVTPYGSADAIDILDCNAVIDTSKKIIENVRELLNGCRGYLPFAGGKYKLVIETTGSASITLTEDDIIGGYSLQSEDKNSKYNRVIVSFVNPDRNYQVDEVQFPEVDDSAYTSADQHATMKTADGGFLLEGRFDMKTITSPYQALEMAEVILRRSRDALKLDINCSGDAYDLAIGDIVAITHSSIGFSAKNMRVVGISFNEDYTLGLSLIEHQDSHYTWATKTQVAATPSTTLPNPFSVVAPASVTLTDELIEYNEGTVLTRLNIVVGASTDQFVQYYQVEAKLSTESDFKIIANGTQLNYEMLNVIDNKTYNVRVKSINALGVSSSYTSASRLIVGATEPPSDVQNFSVNMQGSSQMQLNWDSVSDLDIAFYEIRYQNVTSSAQWNTSVNWLQVPRSSGTTITTNARTGAFLIKAVDKLGNESNNETIIYSNISSLQAYKNISTLTEDITLGTTDGDVALTDSASVNAITLDTITDFDSTIGNFDSPSGDFDLGGTDTTSNPSYNTANIDNEGFYTLNQTLSLDAIYDVSFTKNLSIAKIEDPYDLFDSGRGYTSFEDAPAPFDGNDPTNATTNLQVASSTSSLGAATSFFNMNTSTSYKGRYFNFRLRLANKLNKVRPFVSGISISVNMEKRVESGEDIASTTSAKVITFTNSFYATPAIGISAQNLATGDYYTITSKTKTGFTIQFFNSSNSGINRTFDYVIQGYGLKSAS